MLAANICMRTLLKENRPQIVSSFLFLTAFTVGASVASSTRTTEAVHRIKTYSTVQTWITCTFISVCYNDGNNNMTLAWSTADKATCIAGCNCIIS